MKRLTNKDLVTAPAHILRKRLTKVEFPISSELKETLIAMRQYVVDSYDEQLVEQYDLTPSVGIAANQVGVDARMLVVYIAGESEEDTFDVMMINPVILSESSQQAFIESGEGCLSLPERPEGYVYRPRLIKVRYYDLDGKQHVLELDDFPSIAVQHEIDHLNGILYSDRFDKLNPFIEKNGAYRI